MIATTGIQNFGFEFKDSTVTVLSGDARIGNTIRHFDGAQVSYQSITDFGTEKNVFQNTLLYLQDFGGAVDMTQVLSDTVEEQRSIDFPVMPSDHTDVYSMQYPLGILTFFTDGTTISVTE